MRLPNDPKREKLALVLALFIGLPVGGFIPAVGQDHPLVGAAVFVPVLGLAFFALLYVRRIPRLVLSGLIGGGIAGLVILGGGGRFAMRIVSLTGARREVTIEGTLFLLIFGSFVGANIGVMLAALRRIRPVRVRSTALVLGVLGAFALFGPQDTRAEIFDDGFGVWLNAPMFLALLPGYAWGALRGIALVEQRLPGRRWGRAVGAPPEPAPVTSS